MCTKYLQYVNVLQECEHNLSKPEFNPSSIKFKIQLVALWVLWTVFLVNFGEQIYREE